MAAAMLGNEQVRRFCFNEQIFKAKESYRTHFHSHPDVASIAVAPQQLEGFYKAMAKDAANRTPQCIKEWLTPRFTFFIEVHGTKLLSEDQRLELARFFGIAVSQFNLVPAAILVLGWEGEVSSAIHGFRLRYIFEGVVVDRRRAFTIYTYVMHEAFKDSPEHDKVRKMLLGDKHTDLDWTNHVPSDPYMSPSNGDKTLTMVGSIGMGLCHEDTRIVGRLHNKCGQCLGSRRMPRSMPLSLLNVLDARGQTAEDPSKLDMVDVIRRTSLRTHEPLSDSYMEPHGMPAVALEEKNASTGLALAKRGVFKAERSSQQSASSIEVDDPEMLKVFEAIIRRHDPHYSQLRVRKAFRCGGAKDRYYRVHPHGFNDTWCPNIRDHHNMCQHHQEKGWASRISFEVSERGTRAVCNNKEPVSLLSGRKPCRDYIQRQDLHPLTSAEKEVLKFKKVAIVGGSGPTTHQMMFSILPELHAQINGTAEPKKKKQRRGR